MSSIEKMKISGIRSFSPDHPGTIEFYTPLTVIVGQNGAGKTTIIEALKYATTGDPPPSTGRGGGGFVHDPKVANEREVKAQIKLRFKNVSKKTLTLTRSMSLSVAQKKQTFKTLDTVLQVENGSGDKSSVSSRCGDIDKEMNRQLGVSKAVLENVIFCHQEDSLWPLSEPAALKKKFDEIFAATRYMKALKQLLDLKKEQSSDLRLDKEKVKNVSEHKSRAEEISKTLEKTLRKVELSKVSVQEIEDKIRVTEAELQQRKAQIEQLDLIAKQVNDLVIKKEVKENAYADLGKDLQVLTESDAELGEMLAKYQASLDSEGQGQEALERAARDEEKKIEGFNDQIKKKSVEVELFRHNLEERNNIVVAANERHGIDSSIRRDNLGSLSHEKVAEFSRRLLAKQKDVEDQIQALRKDATLKIRDLQERIGKHQIDISRIKDEIQRNQVTIEKNKKILEDRQRKIDASQISQVEVDDLREKCQQALAALDSLKASLDVAGEERKIQELEVKKRGEDELIGRLMVNLKEVSSQAESATKVTLKRQDVKKNEQQISKLLDENRSKIEKLVGRAPDAKDLEMTLQTTLRTHQHKVREQKVFMEDQKSALGSVQAEIKMRSEELTKKTQELRDKEKRIDDVAAKVSHDSEENFSDRSIPSLLEKTTNLLQSSQRKAILYEVVDDLYTRYIQRAEEEHMCPLCERHFQLEEHMQKFMALMQDTLQKIPETRKEATLLRDKHEGLVGLVQQVRPDWDNCEILMTKEIPTLKSAIERLKEKEAPLAQRISELGADLQRMSEDEESLGLLLKVAERISALLGENMKLTREISQLEATLSKLGNSKSLDDLKSDIDAATRNSSSYSEQIERLRKNLNASFEKIRTSEKGSGELQRQLLIEEQKLKDKLSLLQERSQATNENQELEYRSNTLKPKIQSLDDSIKDLQKEEKQITQQLAQQEAEASANLPKIQADAHRLQTVLREIQKFVGPGGDANPSVIKAEMDSLEAKRKACEARKQDALLQLQDLRSKVHKIAEMKSKIKQNVDYRQLKIDIGKLEAQIATTLAGMSILQNRETLQNECKKFQAELDDAKMNKYRSEGGAQALVEQAKRFQLDLNSDLYRGIEDRYRDDLIKLKTTEMSVADLEKYHKAIDVAIMKYHSMKMQEINKIIRELWVKTYRGQDIDAIEIRSEDEANASRSYNYRVVMIKGDIALDMRGRCSAGQKVLASIVIRLALAETFGLQCGVLALDEPTTNLDRDNIESLAESLGEIIKARMKQSNFQMVVITHDEEFVEMLGKSEYTDYFWRVSKDAQQRSIIERNAASGDRDDLGNDRD